MGYKIPKETPPMERELKCLLGDLCVKWGFCIPPDDFEEISKQEYYHADDFALDVVEAEGRCGYTSWVKKISRRFKERFGEVVIDTETFTDRVRGVKEGWSS